MSPKPFLHRLGIKPKKKRISSDQFREKANCAGYERTASEENSDIMSIQAMDSLFADEKMAIETLSSNFDRLANSMDRLEKSPVFANGKLNRVGELGGGSGVLGMWLAFKNLCEFCEIFDRAKNPLAIGEKWAADLSLKNVDFRHVSYAELASDVSHNFDFVFAEHAVDLNYFSMNSDLSDVVASKCDSPLFQSYRELAGAFNHLLLPGGIGLVGGGMPTPAALSFLCSSLREQQLAIDWKLSSNEDGFLLYVRPRGHIVINSPEDEALAILADRLPQRKVPPVEVRSLETMFRRGTKYVEVYSEAEGVKYKCSIFQCAGLACLFQRNSKGYEGATVFGAGKMHVWTDDVLRDASKRNISSKFIDDRLIPMLNEA